MHFVSRPTAAFVLLTPLILAAQQPAPTQASQAPNSDTSYIDAQGTAHITRVVPIPTTISPEAQKMLASPAPDQAPPESLAERRAHLETYTAAGRAAWTKICPNQIVESKIAGVPVRIVTPYGMPAENRNKVLMDLHGGGFNADSGSYQESIPIASYTGIKVVAVLYRLMPEHPFPAAIDDAVAVYRELLKTYSPKHIVIYGTSAGAILTGQVAVKLKQLGLPMPAALGIFSGTGDFARLGDSEAMYTLSGLSGHLDPPAPGPHDSSHTDSADLRNPILSPIYADLRGMPPTLFVTSERDLLLSGTVNLHRAFLRAGVDARLVVFDALPHGFWYHPELPEAIEANHIMASFFVKELGR
ncbi:MAG: alpha/beta hydrolase fold domain-containing protein [Terracidiphilus sp.]